MVVYEVTLEVDRDALGEFRRWLDHHVGQMLQFDGFEGARVQRRLDAEDERETLVVDYLVASMAQLEVYLRDHAARMRGDGQTRFGGRFAASRRILEVEQERG